MKVAIGSDHAGFELKQKIIDFLQKNSYEMKDFGTFTTESCDYNDVAIDVSQAVKDQLFDRGILICGTGIGMSMQANKVEGIRAALVHDLFSAKATRLHNNANVLCMGGRIIGEEIAFAITDIWLNTEFSNEDRHLRRVDKINR